jgi:hypothetical protein
MAFVVLSVALFTCSVAGAQEKGDIGLTLGYPSVGLVWHVSDSFALRPEVSASLRSGNGTRTSDSGVVSPSGTSDSWGLAFGLSGLFYLRQWEGVRAYLVPRFAYSRSTTTGTSTGGTVLSTSDNTSSDYNVAGSLGLQHSIGRRFSVFGEVGLAYSRQMSSLTAVGTVSGSSAVSSGSDTTTHALGSRSSIGAVFYF